MQILALKQEKETSMKRLRDLEAKPEGTNWAYVIVALIIGLIIGVIASKH